MEKVAIVGAGLVGSLQALYMAQKGYQVDVFERRGDLRKVKLIAGKSINLALSDRGWKALKQVGIDKEIEKVAIPMYGRKMHAVDGTETYQPYGKDGQAIYSVSRGGLNQKMLLLADEHENTNFYFDHKCVDVDLDSNTLIFDHEGTEVKKTYDRIFATDGAFSAVRNRMMKTDRFDYSQTYMKHGYKELLIPANEDGSHKIDPNVLHIWPRGQYMLIALANLDGSFTCTLFFPFEGENSFSTLTSPEKIEAFFKKTFPDAFEMMPDLVEVYNENPTSSLAVVRCYPWHHEDKVMLMGDAAHAIVPFYGQGMNAGFEDCSELHELMEEYGNDWSTINKKYTEIRKDNGDAIATLALNNYIEMRDLTADPNFLLRKKIERKYSEAHPDKWIPLYEQVTFTEIPYSKALKVGEEQRKLMDKVMAIPEIENKWDSIEIEEMITSLLQSEEHQLAHL